LVDIPAGATVATTTVCGPRDQVTGLALEGGPGGLVAYLALWRLRPPAPDGASDASGSTEYPAPPAPPAPSRVVAVLARSGAVVATAPVAGVPALLVAGPAPGRLGRRAYGVERLAALEDEPAAPASARLLGLHPTTLDVESDRPLPFVPERLVLAPDGDTAYELRDHLLTRLGLDGGPDAAVELPGQGLALAVTRERVYVSSAYGRELWAFRRRDGGLVDTLRVGRAAADAVTIKGGSRSDHRVTDQSH
jgi:hypothetical protein